jgi:hypothetical protein
MNIKLFEEKIHAELQQAKAQLDEFDARAKGKMSQAEIETINHLKAKKQEIDKKRQELKTLGEAKREQAKAQIDAEMSKFKASVAELGTKLKKVS